MYKLILFEFGKYTKNIVFEWDTKDSNKMPFELSTCHDIVLLLPMLFSLE